jgi:hypothetical protein
MKAEKILIIAIITLGIIFISIVLWAMLFTERNNSDCYKFYANQYCSLHGMSYDGNTIIPFPVSGFRCDKILGTERIGYSQRSLYFYWTASEIKECTDKPILGWFAK